MSSTNPGFSGGSDPTIRIEHQYDSDTSPSMAIVRAIAVIEDVDPMDSPTDLGLRLYDHLDPAALDQLVSSTSDAVTVDLTVHTDHRYTVRVRESELIVETADRDGV